MKQVKQLTALLFILFGLVSLTAQAALIDQGNSTYDDINGLEWLDVSLTDAMSLDAAMAAYGADGWTVASQVQYQNMFDSYFTGYVDNGTGSMRVTPSTVQYSEALNFINLFGQTYDVVGQTWQASFGLYLEGDIVRLGGVYEGNSFVDLHRDLNNVYSTAGFSSAGIFLVRAASVPEASTLAMLAIGLLGLGFARRRKA